MKKRMIALMLAGIMVLSVTACGGGGAYRAVLRRWRYV